MSYIKEVIQHEAEKHAPLDWLKICSCGMPYENHSAHMVVMLSYYFETIIDMFIAEVDRLNAIVDKNDV